MEKPRSYYRKIAKCAISRTKFEIRKEALTYHDSSVHMKLGLLNLKFHILKSWLYFHCSIIFIVLLFSLFYYFNFYKKKGPSRIWTGDLLICNQLLFRWAIGPFIIASNLKLFKLLKFKTIYCQQLGIYIFDWLIVFIFI